MGESFFAVDRAWRFTALNSAAEGDLQRAAHRNFGPIALGRLASTYGDGVRATVSACHAGALEGGIRKLFGLKPRSLLRGAGLSIWRWRRGWPFAT